MAKENVQTPPEASSGSEPSAGGSDKPAPRRLDEGTYEIIRNRLTSQGRTLRTRLDQLNEARREVFGGIDFQLRGTDRITTEHNCIPRDMIAVGDRLLFGYNVHFGLKTEIDLSDVFAVYEFSEDAFHTRPLDVLRDPRFEKDFRDLYRYYKHTVFAKFFHKGPYLYMKFRVGRDVDDFKAFKWAIDGDSLRYIDNRSDHEVRYPPQHEFEWRRAGRDHQQHGAYPHVSIADMVFVETTGGNLTIKIEDNTESGEGIYSEPVENPDQSLDDAAFHFAVLGHLVLLRIRPYQETKDRYFVYNAKTHEVKRQDSLGHACVLLPDEQGIIFSNGYCLASGAVQVFPNVPVDMVFDRRVAAPNGEDYLYVFYNRREGVYALLPYNIIEQQVDTPIICHGYSLFEDGTGVFFKAQGEAQRHHAIQIWQTPFVGPDVTTGGKADSYLSKLGNRDIVRAMAECVEVMTLIQKDETYEGIYVDIAKAAGEVLDTYFWLAEEACFKLAEPLGQIKAAAQAAIGEFEKVTRIRRSTEQRIADVRGRTEALLNDNATRIYDNINAFVASLGGLRAIRGEIIGLKELRYADVDLIDRLEKEVQQQGESLSRRTVEFLLKPESLGPYEQAVLEHGGQIDSLKKVTEAKALDERIAKTSDELEMLTDIVSNLRIDDATQRTDIIDSISAIFSRLNTARSRLRNRTQKLASEEGAAEFASQMKLLDQSVANFLDVCDTPEKTESYLTKVMVHLEELEGRFAEFDAFVVQLAEKRSEVHNAFENRRLQLLEQRNRRATALATAADRILKGIKSRVDGLDEIAAINGYFAGDMMIEKLRDIMSELRSLDDTVKVDDIQSRLKTIREDAVRQLKDRAELFVEGEHVIRFGKHRFSVNTQAVDLTVVHREGRMYLHLSGTDFFEAIADETFNATREAWDQEIVSESGGVYRGEYLAYQMLSSPDLGGVDTLGAVARYSEEELLGFVQRFMSPRYAEGYTKGVHDQDAAAILKALVEMKQTIGLLRYPSAARALATVFWFGEGGSDRRALTAARLAGYGTILRQFPGRAEQQAYIEDIREQIRRYVDEVHVFAREHVDDAGEYLFHELVRGEDGFAASPEGARLHDEFRAYLKRNRAASRFEASIEGVRHDPVALFMLLRDWLRSFIEGGQDKSLRELMVYLDESAALLFTGQREKARVVDASVSRELSGLVGSHPRIRDGAMSIDYHEFMRRLRGFVAVDVPRYEQFTAAKKRVVAEAREQMRLEEFRPRVLTSFVRNRLIDQTYLPLIGNNLAKQIGVAGEGKRTDRMGLLLLISPPGYGKTTLMEYIANRLGIVFMKINGPAIGHGVTSLDPSEAHNAAAREELHKLNLALEMGDNVMIYVDDIQHTNSEFLQKFISLCDATRRIEGVYKGRTRTYDLRGRKVAVVMAGNPYTESGEKFRIPDMLANRADTYNLGDIIGEHGEAFKLSYLENAITSNGTLNRLAAQSQKDVYGIVRIAETGSREGVDFEGNYSTEEINEMVEVMKKLMRVRDVVLRVNQEYIRSAGMENQYRTEPAFLLQGSYRNMNRIAERIVPIMDEDELRTVIVSSYEQDSQTLTTGAEANLLKFKEMMGYLSEGEAARWESIKRTFERNNALRSVGGDDRTAQVLTQLAGLGQGLGDIHGALKDGVDRFAGALQAGSGEAERAGEMAKQVAAVSAGLASIGKAIEKAAKVKSRPKKEASNGGEVAQALASLRETLAESAGKLLAARTEGPRAEMAVHLDEGSRSAVAALTAQLGQFAKAMASSGQALEAPAPPVIEGMAGPPREPYEIRVINKIPSTFLYVMKEQFNLMRGWLEPLTRINASQDEQLSQLQATLADLSARYEDMIRRLEASQSEEP